MRVAALPSEHCPKIVLVTINATYTDQTSTITPKVSHGYTIGNSGTDFGENKVVEGTKIPEVELLLIMGDWNRSSSLAAARN
jgi:hypothetical protein